MVNFSAKILNNAVAGMRAQQAVIANTGNNIANVSTPGYARRTVELQTRASGSASAFIDVGNGVEVGAIRRLSDAFIEKALRETGSDKFSYSVQKEFLSRLEPLFSLTGERATIGSTLTAFFTSVEDLAANPASLELRANLIARGEDLTNSISQTFKQVAALQQEADSRIATDIGVVNSITSQIASLNSSIKQYEAAGNATDNDNRDHRDTLLQQLAEKISFNSVEQSDGAVSIFLANGFTLVNGQTSRALEVTSTPSFVAGTQPPSLSGGILSSIVYDYDAGAGSSHFDLTQVIKSGGGSVGGLLQPVSYTHLTLPTNREV